MKPQRISFQNVMSLALWKEIQNKVKGVLNLPNLNDYNAHLGFLTEGSGGIHLHNQILLSYKQFLYEHRKIKQSIIITEFWEYLKMVYKIELEIEKKRMTNLLVTIENGQTFFENGIYKRLSISLKIYMIVTKLISFRSDMGGG